MSAPLLDARDVRVAIGAIEILRGADLAVDAGELVAVVGPNGAGKSTLARAVAGLQKTTGGTIRWDGRDLRTWRGRRLGRVRAFVPQRSRVPEGIDVGDAVAIGRAPHLGPLQRATQRDGAIVDEALRRAGVADLAHRRLSTLSGGELQRVQIAVALAQQASALIADEPTSHLDLGAATDIARLVRGLADDGLAVVLVVHDLALAAAIADRVVVVFGGRTVAEGPPDAVLDADLLARVWGVEAAVEHGSDGRTALHVSWLAGPPPVDLATTTTSNTEQIP